MRQQAPGRVIAIANQKGGVGKTTTAINVATALAAAGRKTVLLDLDPQGNASTGLGIATSDRVSGTNRLLVENGKLATLARPSRIPELSIVCAEPDLAGAELQLATMPKREFCLKSAIDPDRHHFDILIVDCPPSLGLLTVNALVAADEVLVPLQCEFFALEGLTQLTRTIEAVRRKLNPSLRIQGIVLTMHDRRNKLSELVAADARGFFGAQVFDTVIPRSVRVSEAPSHGQPVLLYDLRSAGAQAYIRLAQEVLSRERAAGQA